MRYAVVEDATSIVVNVIEAEAPFEIPGCTMYPGENANIGDTTFDGINYIPPPSPSAPPSFSNDSIMGSTIFEIITS